MVDIKQPHYILNKVHNIHYLILNKIPEQHLHNHQFTLHNLAYLLYIYSLLIGIWYVTVLFWRLLFLRISCSYFLGFFYTFIIHGVRSLKQFQSESQYMFINNNTNPSKKKKHQNKPKKYLTLFHFILTSK